MTRIHWTEQAAHVLETMKPSDADALLDRLDLLEQFPAMYPQRQRGRFAGLRYFVINKRWIMYYRILNDTDLLILDIFAAMASKPAGL